MSIPSVDIDFEVFSEVSIGDVGLHNYARHPSTKIICMAYSINDGEVHLWTPGLEHDIPADYHLVAHNAPFEYELILVHGDNIGIGLPHSQTCTAARAAAMSLPRSLKGASAALDLHEQKDEAGKRVMLQVCQPRKPSKTNPATNWFFNEKKMRTTYDYCIQDVVVEKEIYHNTFPLRPTFESQVFDMDHAINSQGVPVDLKLVEGAIAMADKFSSKLDEEVKDLSNGKIAGVNATSQYREYFANSGYAITSVAKDVLPDLLEMDLPSDLHRLIECRKEGALSSVAKFRKIQDWTAPDGRLRHMFMYHGAHTGRWTGKGPQLHNLPRGLFKGDKTDLIDSIRKQDTEAFFDATDDQDISPLEALSSVIRETFCADEGHTFVAGDYAGIEVRVLAWLANQEDLLELLEQNGDPYKDMASTIYQTPIEEITSDQRALGKMAVLGLGYQMGAPKFREQCKAQAGITIDESMARRVVDTYRNKYGAITKFWYGIEAAMLRAVKTGHATFRGIKFMKSVDILTCILPSGRPIYYMGVDVKDGRFGKEQVVHRHALGDNWLETDTYGGKITENVVQAVARDLLAQGMLRLHMAGFTPCLHVHDEAVLHVPLDQAEIMETKFTKALTQRETWSEGVPLDVETWIGRRYHK